MVRPIAIALTLIAAAATASDLRVTVTSPDEPTGTMHYATTVTVAFEDASPLVLDGEMVPIPGPHFRLSDSRFLLLAWSSSGSGMQTLHALLLSIRRRSVALDRWMMVETDRGSAGLLIRVSPHSARIGLPEPPVDFVHNPDDWFLSLGGARKEPFDLEQMRKLKYTTVSAQKGDVFYTSSDVKAPAPKRVAWINITSKGFALAR